MASVASTYARAFADVVLDTHLDADRAIADLRAIAGLLNESSDLRRVWENPAIPAEQTRGVVLDVIAQARSISKQARNLVAILIDHRRTHFSGRNHPGNWRKNSTPGWVSPGQYHQLSRTGQRGEKRV